MKSTPRPPTPPSSTPLDRSQWRFKPITLLVEWVESYRPGGLHPTALGDSLRDGRYRIIRKLGSGSFSTVWLARDYRESRFVALKIAVAGSTAASKEVFIYDHLQKACNGLENLPNLTALLDSFQHRGPNGTHQCLAFEAMGPSASFMLENPLPGIVSASARKMFDLPIAKSFIKQLLQGLRDLHQHGVAHGDVQYGNLLIGLKDLGPDAERIIEEEDRKNPPALEAVERTDGRIDPWAPKYLIEEKPLSDFVDVSPRLIAKLSDMGASFLITDPPAKSVTPMSLRAPESILERPIDHRIDIWSFGCLFFEFLTGTPLFAVFHMAGTSQRETDDDHLLQMIDIIGHLPPELCSHWTRYDRYFDKSLRKIRTNVGEGDSVEEELITSPSLEDFFKESKPKEMNDAECADVIALLRSILQFNPNMRPTANDILQHPYMAAIEIPQMTKSSETV